METLQVKLAHRQAEVKLLEVAIAKLRSTDKDHQEKILAASAINGMIARCKEKLQPR